MATSTLQVVVETNTRKLDALTSKFKKTQTQLQKLQGNLRTGLVNSFRAAGNAGQAAARKIGTAFANAGKKVSGFQKKLGGLRTAILGIGIGAGVRSAFGAATEFESAETRINSLTKSYSKFAGIQDIAAKSAEKFRTTQTESLQAYADLGSRLGGTATSLQDLENIYEGFNTLLINNKVEAQQAAAAQLQLGQALGEGVLRAEEYNSLISATPQLLDEVARVLNVPRGGLKALAAEGKISAETLIQALTNIRTKGADQLEDSLNGAFGASKDFNKAANELAKTIGTDLLPALVPLLKAATDLLKLFGDLPEPVRLLTLAIAGIGTAALIAAPALGAVAGGLAALAPAAVAAGGGAQVLAGAMVALNVAMAAAPWALLAGGLVYVAKGAVDAQTKIDALEKSLRDTSGTGEVLTQKIAETEAKIADLKGQIDKAGPSADYLRKKIELLTASLQEMQGRYEIEIVLSTYGVDVGSLEDGFYGPGAKAPEAVKPKPKPTLPTVGGSSGGGGGAAVRESEIPALTRQLELSDKLLQIDKERLEAQFQGNSARIKELSELRVITELEGKRAEITAEEIPDAEKKLKIQLAENEAALAGLDIKYQSLELEKQRREALEGILSPIQDEIELLQGKLAGNEEEIRQKQEILRLEKAIADQGGDPSQAAGLIRQRDQLKELNKEQDEAKAKAEALAGAISGTLTDSLRGLVDGSMSAEEALTNAFEGIADAFLDMAMQMIQEWLKMQVLGIIGGMFGGPPSTPGAKGTLPGTNFFESRVPGLATGGTANGGQPYVVGEKGPELFIPGVTGTVTNNDQFEAARNAMGGSSSGADDAFADNTSSISTTNSYMRDREYETNNQTTVGGAGSMVIETQVINNVEYATLEQVRIASAASEKKARAQVFSDMKNKPSRRAMVGLK